MARVPLSSLLVVLVFFELLSPRSFGPQCRHAAFAPASSTPVGARSSPTGLESADEGEWAPNPAAFCFELLLRIPPFVLAAPR